MGGAAHATHRHQAFPILNPFKSARATFRCNALAKLNYRFEKSQRDRAKKKKREEKLQRKLARKIPANDATSEASADQPEQTESDAVGEPTGN